MRIAVLLIALLSNTAQAGLYEVFGRGEVIDPPPYLLSSQAVAFTRGDLFLPDDPLSLSPFVAHPVALFEFTVADLPDDFSTFQIKYSYAIPALGAQWDAWWEVSTNPIPTGQTGAVWWINHIGSTADQTVTLPNYSVDLALTSIGTAYPFFEFVSPGMTRTGREFVLDPSNVVVNAVPDAGVLPLMGLGLLGLIGRRRARRAQT